MKSHHENKQYLTILSAPEMFLHPQLKTRGFYHLFASQIEQYHRCDAQKYDQPHQQSKREEWSTSRVRLSKFLQKRVK